MTQGTVSKLELQLTTWAHSNDVKDGESVYIMDMLKDIKDVHENHDSDPQVMFSVLEHYLYMDKPLGRIAALALATTAIALEEDIHTMLAPNGLHDQVVALRKKAVHYLNMTSFVEDPQGYINALNSMV